MAEKKATKTTTRTAAQKERAAKTETPPKPKQIVAGDTFICQTSEGELQVPLKFKTKLIRQIRDQSRQEDLDDMDQFVLMLEGTMNEAALEIIDELDLTETMAIVEDFFEKYSEKIEASLGE